MRVVNLIAAVFLERMDVYPRRQKKEEDMYAQAEDRSKHAAFMCVVRHHLRSSVLSSFVCPASWVLLEKLPYELF